MLNILYCWVQEHFPWTEDEPIKETLVVVWWSQNVSFRKRIYYEYMNDVSTPNDHYLICLVRAGISLPFPLLYSVMVCQQQNFASHCVIYVVVLSISTHHEKFISHPINRVEILVHSAFVCFSIYEQTWSSRSIDLVVF